LAQQPADITRVLERDTAIEQYLSVRLDGLAAIWRPGLVSVRGELSSLEGGELKQNLCVQVCAYDGPGQIVAYDFHRFPRATFYGRDVFQIDLRMPDRPARLRIFPKKDAVEDIQFDNVERLEMIEEQLGVRLEGLFVSWNSDSEYLEVHAELYASEGTTLKYNVQIIATAYDETGRVLGTAGKFYLTNKFVGLATVNFRVECPIVPARLRIYPERI
jgi:hypothetical protein